MTGPFGSGCSYIANEILTKVGYEYISLSDILKSNIENGEHTYTRSELQDKGNELRREKGAGYLAKIAIDIIESSPNDKFVIDSNLG